MPEGLEPEATSEVVETEGATTAESSVPEEETWADLDALPEDQDLFPRKYVEELRDREAKYRIKGRDLFTEVDGLGGIDTVKSAVELQRQLSTEDGTIAMFIEAGRALGLGIKDMENLFGETPGNAPKSELDSLDDDAPLTAADARRMVEEAIQNQVIAPQAEAQFQAQLQGAQSAVRDTLAELKVSEADVDAVLLAGQRYLADGDYDPAHVANAVRRGQADHESSMRARAEQYAREKLDTQTKVPSSTGSGSTPGGTDLPEPANVQDAKKRARQRLQLSGG